MAFGRPAASIWQFRELGRPHDALQIPIDQLGFRRAADLASGNNVKKHLLCGGGCGTQRPGQDRLEALINDPRRFSDRPRPVGATTG
jgi:hypothetical protein